MTPSAPVTLDDILDQFLLEHDAPTSSALAALLRLHPDHRESIVAFSTTWCEQRLLPAEGPVGHVKQQGFIEKACALFESAAAKRDASSSPTEQRPQAASPAASSLFELAQRAGLSLVDLVPLLGLDIGIVAKLDKRSIRLDTMPERLFSAIARAISCSIREIQEALAGPAAQAMPSFMIVRSGASTRPESFADAVRASTLPAAAKASWLTDAP
jgi:hypothetical protein